MGTVQKVRKGALLKTIVEKVGCNSYRPIAYNTFTTLIVNYVTNHPKLYYC